MYEAVKQIGFSAFAAREIVPFVMSILIAEWLYKFHSFTLETLAFLATWYVVSATAALVRRRGD